jgi:mRNA interferase RelE/StbE
MPYTVRFKPAAYRQWLKIPEQVRSRIQPALDAPSENPFHAGVAKMQGEPGMYRIRVGDYRIIYTVKSTELLVLIVRLGHRREVYR